MTPAITQRADALPINSVASLIVASFPRSCWSNSYLFSSHDNDGTIAHRIIMTFDQIPHRVNLFRHSQLDQPHNTRVWTAVQKDQFAKVLVLGNEHSVFFICQGEQFFVCSTGISIPGRQDVMAKVNQRFVQCPRCRTGIEEKPHEAWRMAIRSCTCSPAIDRCAKSRQA